MKAVTRKRKAAKALCFAIKHFQKKMGRDKGVEFVRSNMTDAGRKLLERHGIKFPQDFL